MDVGVDGLNGYIWVVGEVQRGVDQLPQSGNATLTAATVPTCSPQLQTVIIIIVIIIMIIIIIMKNIMIIISIIEYNTLN